MGNISKVKTDSGFFAKYVIFNFIGQGFIILVGLFSIPMLIKGFGTDRFAILTLAWALTGYFSIFDLGISRGITKSISEKLGDGKLNEIPSIVWTGLLMMLTFGLIGALILSTTSSYLVMQVLAIPNELQDETLKAFLLISLSIPIVIITSSLRGILEAYQRFDYMNYIRIPLGALTYLSSLILIPFTKNLFYIIASLVFVRVIELLFNSYFCLRILPDISKKIDIKGSIARSLIKFGGWITVSNIVGPLLAYMDRFLISSMITIKAVAYYSTAYELNSRLMIIPSSIVGVLFSAFGATYNQNRELAGKIFFGGLKYTYLLIFPLILLIISFAKEGLSLWIGEEFALESKIVLQILVFGQIFNSLSFMPTGLIQAAGRPELTAKINAIELPIYLLILYWLVNSYGIKGAALAYLFKSFFDSLILNLFANKLLLVKQSLSQLIIFIMITIPLFLIPIYLSVNLVAKFFIIILIIIFFLFLGWKKILDSSEREFFHNKIKIFITN
jgi:O-antigen/teichoic acid export membrane protein